MVELNKEQINKLRRGEICGNIATGFCGAVLVYFIICFTLAEVYSLFPLQLSTLIAAPVLMVAGIAVAAYCNLKFGNAIDKIIKDYVRDVFVENAALMHPERDSLTFYFSFDKTSATVRVNNYKEKIYFDFSAFGKLSAMRSANVSTAITDRLTVSFCRLFERGVKFKDVSYTVVAGLRRKQGKIIYIIKNGGPDKRALKTYLKNK